MSYSARKSSIHVAIILIAALVLAGCQGGGGSDSSSGVTDLPGDDGGQDNSQETASLASDSAVLSWEAPGYRVNGDTLKDGHISHYVVSWGQDPENLSRSTEVTCQDCQAMEHKVEELDEGTWYFTVQTVDQDGLTSPEADLATKKI
ncbi:hypothetical protein CK501_11055 [Halovibrio salipaludis]|uniref:Fibronectin type-III domain-containing protein n=1 Tax=Halovibrio salipaludis TaxID=2032626 RepID=A0A2A2F635_9GAMM|nr:fibronectin type III domain-containing protein [Halovibrio salipaludis]PAU80174.1 hypothetical protein CK501_11055 [Halovibrio salipaludis]